MGVPLQLLVEKLGGVKLYDLLALKTTTFFPGLLLAVASTIFLMHEPRSLARAGAMAEGILVATLTAESRAAK
jgi:hypothetical protein